MVEQIHLRLSRQHARVDRLGQVGKGFQGALVLARDAELGRAAALGFAGRGLDREQRRRHRSGNNSNAGGGGGTLQGRRRKGRAVVQEQKRRGKIHHHHYTLSLFRYRQERLEQMIRGRCRERLKVLIVPAWEKEGGGEKRG